MVLSPLLFTAGASADPPEGVRDGWCRKGEGIAVVIDVSDIPEAWPLVESEYPSVYEEPVGYVVRCINGAEQLQQLEDGPTASIWSTAMRMADVGLDFTFDKKTIILGLRSYIHAGDKELDDGVGGSGKYPRWYTGGVVVKDGVPEWYDPSLHRITEEYEGVIDNFAYAKYALYPGLNVPDPVPGVPPHFEESGGGGTGNQSDGPGEGPGAEGPGDGPGADGSGEGPGAGGPDEGAGAGGGLGDGVEAPEGRGGPGAPDLSPAAAPDGQAGPSQPEPAADATASLENPAPSAGEEPTPSSDPSSPSAPPQDEIWGEDARAAPMAATTAARIWPWLLAGIGTLSLAGVAWVVLVARRRSAMSAAGHEAAAPPARGQAVRERDLPEEEPW